ncbi:DUF5711 family protein [Fusibacter bizertensis]
MKKSLSLIVLLICILFVLRFESAVSEASKLFNENYKLKNQIYFNLNNDFEYRAQIFSIDHAFVIVGRAKVQYISDQGNLLWEKDVSSQNVSVASGTDFFVLAEKKAGDIFIIDKQGNITEKRFGVGAIESIKSFDNGYVGVIKTNHEFDLLDKKLKTICSTKLPSGTVLDYNLIASRQNISFLLLDLNHAEFNSKLVITTFNGSIVSGSNIAEEIGYGMKLMKDQIIVLVDNALLFYDYNGKRINELKIDQTISSFLLDSSSYLYLNNQGNNNITIETPPEKLITVNAQGKTISEFKPDLLNIIGMKRIGDKLMIYSKDKVEIIGNSGDVEEVYNATDEIKAVHAINDTSFAIEYINHLDIYTQK